VAAYKLEAALPLFERERFVVFSPATERRSAWSLKGSDSGTLENMTWVCAASTIFGYGALYADVQVTFRDGRTQDLVQKAYPLGNFVAAGFAGSVHIGFMLLEGLSDYLALPSDDLKTMACDPRWVSANWAPLARSLYDQAPEGEKLLGSRILMVGVSPSEPCGLGAKVYFTRFASPDFRPCLMSRAIKTCSIGSGAGMNVYKQRLKPHFRLTDRIHQAEVGQEGGWARQIGFSISRALSDHPRSGISRHMHILMIRRGSILVETNDENIYHRDGSRLEIRMPVVARGYAEFQAMAASSGHEVEGAIG